MKIKRMLSALLTVVLMMGCLAGCGKENKAEAGETLMPSISTFATGRYVEQEIPLPECQYAMDMVMLEDGRLRVALEQTDGIVVICTSDASRATWADTVTLPGEILDSGNVESVALSPNGMAFCSTMEHLEDETHQPHLWVLNADGTCRELPVMYEDVNHEMA